MLTVKAITLFLQTALLLVQYLRERELVGLGRQQALAELKELLDERIEAAATARASPHDDSVPDEFDRAGAKSPEHGGPIN